MDTKGPRNQQILLLSLVGIILPLVIFPARLGSELARPSLVNTLYELVFYGLVVFWFHRRASLVNLIGGAGVCLIYRLVIGAVFGLLIAAIYSMELGVSFSLGMSGYLPATLFHIAIAPFVLKPVIGQLISTAEPNRRGSLIPPEAIEPVETGRSSVVASKARGVATAPIASRPETRNYHEPAEPTARSAPAMPVMNRALSEFEKAVFYIGEHRSVHLAAVVDDEGLLLGNFTRQQVDPEAWAPLALLFMQGGRDVLKRGDLDGLERLELLLKEKRLVVARSEGCSLMVLSERHDDDLLNIRISQGLDMINRLVAERYGNKLNSNAERTHVSSAQ